MRGRQMARSLESRVRTKRGSSARAGSKAARRLSRDPPHLRRTRPPQPVRRRRDDDLETADRMSGRQWQMWPMANGKGPMAKGKGAGWSSVARLGLFVTCFGIEGLWSDVSERILADETLR